MNELFWQAVESLCAFFHKDNDIDSFNIPVAECFALFPLDAFVLAQEQVGHVAGTALPGKGVADALDLDIGNAAVCQFHNNVHDEEGVFGGNPGGFVGKDVKDLDLTAQDKGKQELEAFRDGGFLKLYAMVMPGPLPLIGS